MVQVVLILVPTAWLAWLLGLALKPWLAQLLSGPLLGELPRLMEWAPRLTWVGPSVALAGFAVALWALMLLKRRVMLASTVLMPLGGALWLVGVLLQPQILWLQWTGTAGFALMTLPALVMILIELILDTDEDDLGRSMMMVGGFTALVAVVHGLVVGW